MEEKKLETPAFIDYSQLRVTDCITPDSMYPEGPEDDSMGSACDHISDIVRGQLYGMDPELPALYRAENNCFYAMVAEVVVYEAAPEFVREAIEEAIARLGRVEDLGGELEARRQVLLGYLREVGER